MEMFLIIGFFLIAVIMEMIDSGLGMMYGTLLSPILIACGISPSVVIPSILLSQFFGGLAATINHNIAGNAVLFKRSMDLKITFSIILSGIIAIILGVYLAANIPVIFLKSYIGALCIIMGSVIILEKKLGFSWLKIYIIGFVSSFNKSFSGGGFGPIVSSGQIVSGVDSKKSIAITDFAEVPICLISFFGWFVINKMCFPDLYVLIPLCIGAFIGGIIGPHILKNIKSKDKLSKIVAILAIISGSLIFGKLLR